MNPMSDQKVDKTSLSINKHGKAQNLSLNYMVIPGRPGNPK